MIAGAAAVVCGVGAVGALLLFRGLVPPRLSLSERLDEAMGVSTADARCRSQAIEWLVGVEAAIVRPRSLAGLADRRADLTITGVESTGWYRRRLLTVIVFAVTVLAVSGPVSAGTAGGGFTVVVASIGPPAVGAAIGWWAEEQRLIAKARSARVAFGHAVAIYLELATVALAGGSGPAEAMRAAASLGSGLAFRQIRGAVAEAEMQLQSPYRALEGLGTAVAVVELRDVGSAMALAEEKGVSIRDTLEAKARSVASRLMSAEEARAESRSVAMSLPSVLMLSGFLLFLMYPFVAALVATTK